jgi:hypothetical protein
MAKTTTLPVAQTIQNGKVSLVNATGAVGTTLTTTPSNAVLLFTAGAEGAVVKSITVTSDDTAARVLVFYISSDGTTYYPLFTVNVPLNSGATGAIVNIDILGSAVVVGLPIDQSGKPVLMLKASERVYVGTQVAVTAAKFINIVLQAEDF